MRSAKHFRLVTLGRLGLEAVVGETATPVAVRPRHLAVLVVLALSPRAVRRDALAALFWGDEPESNARHSLSNALSALRAALGPESISGYRDEVALSDAARLAVDAVAFAAACDVRDHERAAGLYGGPFLDGLVVQGARGFDAWVDRERAALERRFVAACEQAAPGLLRAGRWDDAAALAERWLHAAPASPTALTTLLRARAAAGDPASLRAARAEFDRVRRWLATEHDLQPDAATLDLVAELETKLDTAVPEAADADTADPDTAAPETAVLEAAVSGSAAPAVSVSASWRRRIALGALGIVAAVGLVVWRASWLAGAREPRADVGHPVVAITDVENVRGDTALAWLQTGLPQLIAEDLARASTLDAVAPSRVREVVARRGLAPGARLSEQDAIDVARRVGATWAVSGGLTGGGGLYVLDLAVRDTRSGAMVQSFSVFARDPVQLGHLAATRLLDVASALPSGSDGPPRFADAATTSAEAYRQYVLGARDFDEGRFRDAAREFDAAIALDSGFVSAIEGRRIVARVDDEAALEPRLDALLARHRDRMSEWDRSHDEVERAMFGAEVERSEALAAQLVARFPRDPRAYAVEADVLATHGRWLAADSVRQRELALDSLAMAAGDGPCAPCGAYAGLISVRIQRGDLAGAERAARRWVALQPTVPGAWQMLADAVEYSGRVDEAIDAERRALLLSADPEYALTLGRTLLAARRYHEVDSLIATLRRRPEPLARDGALDLGVMLARERGEFRRAAALLGPDAETSGLALVQADNLARMGRLAEARALYEWSGHPGGRVPDADAEVARAYTWAHVLEGDALWRAGDTTTLRALADSVGRVSAASYYGRDWVVPHHLTGLLALTRGDSTAAERELAAARWGTFGWTRTVVELGRLRLARGRADDAIATLRDGYRGPLDAMGRYVPRSELDWWMAQAFARAGRADSAAVYAGYVRAAWAVADPDVRRRLAALPR